MSCPICGANCRCRKRGPGGICCGCHRHKVRGQRLAKGSPELMEWRKLHGYAIPPEEPKPKQEEAAAAARQLDLFKRQEPAE